MLRKIEPFLERKDDFVRVSYAHISNSHYKKTEEKEKKHKMKRIQNNGKRNVEQHVYRTEILHRAMVRCASFRAEKVQRWKLRGRQSPAM